MCKKFDQNAGKLERWIDFERSSSFSCEDKKLGSEGYLKAYDTTEKTWRHLNFFQSQCDLRAWIPRVDLGNGKIRHVQTPWECHAAGFTSLFEFS
ncbi:MAG: hypothetical protein Q8M08_03110 [Bacteroidales bacterium]|nr:hypothetical protein [Bacteroidales bacterium]